MEFTHSGEPEHLPMILSMQEWLDVAHMAEHYAMCTEWVNNRHEAKRRNGIEPSASIADIHRRRALAERITNARPY